MTFLETAVFANEVKIVTTDDNGTLHLQFLDNSVQDPSTDANVASEWAFLVDVGTIDGLVICGRDREVERERK